MAHQLTRTRMKRDLLRVGGLRARELERALVTPPG